MLHATGCAHISNWQVAGKHGTLTIDLRLEMAVELD
jgi:hypothetical protein